MNWNPFDLVARLQDPNRNGWAKAEQWRDEHQGGHERRQEIARATVWPSIVILAASLALRATSGIETYWLDKPVWADVIRGVAAVSGTIICVRLGMLARKRYAPLPDQPFAPAWFRGLLAAAEMLNVVAVVAFAVIFGTGVRGVPFEVALALVAVGFVARVGHDLLRWWTKPYGWVTGRLFERYGE